MSPRPLNENAVVVSDTDGVIQFWSEGATRLFGFTPQQTVGQRLDIMIPANYRDVHWKGFDKAMATGIAATDGTFFNAPVLCSDGEVRKFRGQLLVLRNENKEAIGAMAIFTVRPDRKEPKGS